MIYTVQTTQPINTIKMQLERRAKEVGFGVLNSYEFQNILESKDFPIAKDITVYELCNPKAAQEALGTIPAISVYLPCRISVYEDAGKTTLVTIGFEDILNAVKGDEDFPTHLFETHMINTFKNLKKLMHSWDN
jgi:uncharacterized protein (DUF302 family)